MQQSPHASAAQQPPQAEEEEELVSSPAGSSKAEGGKNDAKKDRRRQQVREAQARFRGRKDRVTEELRRQVEAIAAELRRSEDENAILRARLARYEGMDHHQHHHHHHHRDRGYASSEHSAEPSPGPSGPGWPVGPGREPRQVWSTAAYPPDDRLYASSQPPRLAASAAQHTLAPLGDYRPRSQHGAASALSSDPHGYSLSSSISSSSNTESSGAGPPFGGRQAEYYPAADPLRSSRKRLHHLDLSIDSAPGSRSSLSPSFREQSIHLPRPESPYRAPPLAERRRPSHPDYPSLPPFQPR